MRWDSEETQRKIRKLTEFLLILAVYLTAMLGVFVSWTGPLTPLFCLVALYAALKIWVFLGKNDLL